ncbi:MAG: SPOR domain-containing protein [Acidiferrobacter sp.]
MEEGPFDPRQRLIGAIVLVVLAVVVLPILLRHPSSHTAGRDVLTIQRAGQGLQTHWSKAAPQSTPGNAVVSPVPAASGSVSADHAEHPVPVGSVAAHAPSVPPEAAKPKRVAAAPPRGSWYVQVGAYVNAVDAIAFGKHLRAQGFPVHVKLARLPSGRGVVVFLGPYTRAQAQKARGAVARRDKVQGIFFHTTARTR